MDDRYEWLRELKAEPVKSRLVEELARHAAQGLSEWPPPVAALESTAAIQWYEGQSTATRPSASAVRYGLQLTRMELRREVEAIDHAMRTDAWRGEVADAAELERVWWLVRWLLDLLLEVREQSRQRLTRDDLVEVVDRIERKLG